MLLKNTDLFEKAQESRYVSNWFVAYIFVFALLFASQIISIFITITIALFFKIPMENLFILTLIIAFPLSLLFLLLWVTLVEKRKFRTIGFTKKNFIMKYVKGFGLGFVLMSIVVGILWSFGTLSMAQKINSFLTWPLISGILLIIPAWAIQSSTEEAISRGWLMHILGAKYTPAIGLFLSSLAFGLLHLFNDSINVIAIINIILVGVFLGLYVIKEGDLWVACGIHTSWNWAQGNIYGFEVSGNNVSIGSLLKFNDLGPDWITGGNFGPEAGVVSTAVLGIAALFLFLQLKKQRDT